MTTFREGEHPITLVSMSADGTRVISKLGDKTICIWDAWTGRALHKLNGHPDGVMSVKLLHDDTRIISKSNKCTRIWDAQTGAVLLTVKTRSDVGVGISHDETRIIFQSDKCICLWDAKTGAVLHEFTSQPGEIIRISEDTTRIISGSYEKIIRILDAQTGSVLHTFEGLAYDEIIRFPSLNGISQDGTRTISVVGQTIYIQNAQTGVVLYTLKGYSERIRSVRITRNGTRVVSAGDQARIRIWDAQIGAALHTLEGSRRPCDGASVAISHDGNIISESGDGTICWDTLSDTPMCFYPHHIFNFRRRDEAFSSVSFVRGPNPPHVVEGRQLFDLRDGWLLKGEKKVCWVPPDRRGFEIVAQSASAVVMVRESAMMIVHSPPAR